MTATPVSLLLRLKEPSDREAWTRFVELYTPLLHFWAGRVGLRDEEAADLVQDVFALLLRKMAEFTYDKNGRFRAWLRVVLLNKWRETQRRDRSRVSATGCENLDQVTISDDVDPFWEVEYRQHLARRALELMQATFHPTTWRACWEMVVEGRPVEEVANELGITVGAAYVAKSRVLRRLREELDGLMD
jgi:RNA polymerase sigma-70 factor (ECF subfamily)